jgi:hypothetical protein
MEIRGYNVKFCNKAGLICVFRETGPFLYSHKTVYLILQRFGIPYTNTNRDTAGCSL